jgi:hypothetical protein
LDSQVSGSLLVRNTVFLEPAILDTVSLLGELGMRGAAFPYVLVQFSKIGGVFDLTKSQARCAYDIRQSEIGELIAVDSGFGTAQDKLSFDWGNLKEELKKRIQAARKAPPVLEAADDKICNHPGIASSPATFLISDTGIKSSLCLRSFHWLEANPPQDSYITFDDVRIGTLLLLIWSPVIQISAALKTIISISRAWRPSPSYSISGALIRQLERISYPSAD